jgi:tetratricopeptide (TPR) repeat protein
MLANIPARIAIDRAFLAGLRGDAEGATAFVERAQAEVGEDEWMLAVIIRWNLAVAGWLRGELAEAERAFVSSVDGWSAAGEVSLVAWACEHLGQLQRAQGRLDAALGTYRRALELTAPPGRPALPAAGIAQVGMAEVAYQRGELDAALRHATDDIALGRQFTSTQTLATGLATLAWIRQAGGDAAGALDAIEEAGRVAPSPTLASLVNPVPTQRARLLLAQGNLAAAVRWTDERGLDPDDQPSYPREPEYLVLVRVLLAGGQADRALRLLERWHALAASQERIGSVIEMQALQALAQAARGDPPPPWPPSPRRSAWGDRGVSAGVRRRGPTHGDPGRQAAGPPAPGAADGGRRYPEGVSHPRGGRLRAGRAGAAASHPARRGEGGGTAGAAQRPRAGPAALTTRSRPALVNHHTALWCRKLPPVPTFERCPRPTRPGWCRAWLLLCRSG